MKGKEKILRAAVRVFAQKGYKAATVREIMAEAGAANPSAVTYHFKGKENLYRAVLEFMLQDADKFIPTPDPEATEPPAREKLRRFILIYMKVLYVLDTDLDADLSAIFAKELAHPSPFLEELARTYLTPGSEQLKDILGQLTGLRATPGQIQACEDSIMGQIYYPLFAAPLIAAARPGEPPTHEQIQAKADHIFEFSLGALERLCNSLKNG